MCSTLCFSLSCSKALSMDHWCNFFSHSVIHSLTHSDSQSVMDITQSVTVRCLVVATSLWRSNQWVSLEPLGPPKISGPRPAARCSHLLIQPSKCRKGWSPVTHEANSLSPLHIGQEGWCSSSTISVQLSENQIWVLQQLKKESSCEARV